MEQTQSKNLKNRFRTVAKIENRMLCPACPVVIERAVFVYDYELGNKLIQFVLRNSGEKVVTGAVVRFRCYDGAGNCLYPGDVPDFSITFNDQNCPRGGYFTDRRAVKLFSYDIVNYRAWVTRVTYADGSVEDFAPEQYIERAPRILFSTLLTPKEEKALKKAWGKQARCVPVAIRDKMWMCCCGTCTEEEICPECGKNRTVLSPYFGEEATYAYAVSRARRGGLLRGIVAAVLILCLLGALGAGAWYMMQVAYPAATVKVTDLYLAEGRYNEALAFVRKRKDTAQEARVLTAARDAALAGLDYEMALLYDSLTAAPDAEAIYRRAAADALTAIRMQTVDFTAAGYGLLTSDEALYDELIHGLINYCEENNLYRQAASYTRMLHNMEEEALVQVFNDAVNASLERGNYEEALSWAEQHPNEEFYFGLVDTLFEQYFTAGDYAKALEFAIDYAESEVYFSRIMEAADARFVAENITDIYFKLSEEDRRSFHASPLALSKQVAYIDAEGNVKGLEGVSWGDAVSLSMNEFHTLCLFSDGRVEAAGNSGYGRTSVSSWKNVVDIAAGERHSVGLRAVGKVSAVGDNSQGQCNVTNWNGILDVAAGRYHTVGLRFNGTVVATGSNASGQCDVSGYADIIAVEAGDWMTVLLHRDGSVTVLGNTALGVDEANSWTDIVAISAGSSHVLGLTSDGRVLMAGRPISGDAGSPEGWPPVTEIAAGSVCIAGLTADGQLYLAGDGAPAVH